MAVTRRMITIAIAALTVLLVGIEILSIRAIQNIWYARGAEGCACASGLPIDMAGWLAFGMVGLFLVGFSAAVIYLVTTLIRTHRLMTMIRWCRQTTFHGVPVYLLEGKRCGAFTLGLLHPKITVCWHCVEVLSSNEVAAMLRHEECHVERRDPLRFFVLEVIKRMYFFVPILRPLISTYRTISEVEADERVSDRENLGRALLHMAGTGQVVRDGASFASEIHHRIARLIDPQWKMVMHLSKQAVVASGGVFLFMVLLLSHAPAKAPQVRTCILPAGAYACEQPTAPLWGR